MTQATPVYFRATAYLPLGTTQDAHHADLDEVRSWADNRAAEGYTVIVERIEPGFVGDVPFPTTLAVFTAR